MSLSVFTASERGADPVAHHGSADFGKGLVEPQRPRYTCFLADIFLNSVYRSTR
jgi:hypothetical protein